MLVDLHVHVGTRGLSINEAVDRARQVGLDAVVLVDDDRLPDVKSFRDGDDGDTVVLAGAEVSTDRGHYVLVFPNPSELPPLEAIFGDRSDGSPWPARDVLARTKALGGAAVAAHPYDRSVPNPSGDVVFTLRGITAIEAVNPSRPADIVAPAVEAADYLELPRVGGSDARGSLDHVGRGATLFATRFTNEAGLIAALQRGECWPVEFSKPPFA